MTLRRMRRALGTGAAIATLSFALVGVLCFVGSAAAQSGGHGGRDASFEGLDPLDPDGPRSRLLLSGAWELDTYRQTNFFLGARAADPAADGSASDTDAFWTQRLTLLPRFVLSDNLNLNLGIGLASGVWGLDIPPSGTVRPGYGAINSRDHFLQFQVDWAYAAWRHAPTRTRWYAGRQAYGLGNLIVLDMDAMGIQGYHDLDRWNGSVGFGVARISEGVFGLTDFNGLAPPDTLYGPDGRDADLVFAEARLGGDGDGLEFRPFFVWYADRGIAGGSSFLPDRQGYLDARFRPHVTRARVIGLTGRLQRGVFRLDAEFDLLSGKDGIENATTGPSAVHDVNDGDLEGRNLFGRLSLNWQRLEVGAIVGMGSGDDDPFTGKGNINHLRTQGHFYLTEIWEDGLALDERGMVPLGFGDHYHRGYRGLENTRIYQGNVAIRPRPDLRVFASYSMIRADKALRPWFDRDRNGVISAEEYGQDFLDRDQVGSSTELGSEIDLRVDWTVQRGAVLTVAGGRFSPGVAAGYLLNGTEKHLENATEIRAGLRLSIPEFSLGG